MFRIMDSSILYRSHVSVCNVNRKKETVSTRFDTDTEHVLSILYVVICSSGVECICIVDVHKQFIHVEMYLYI